MPTKQSHELMSEYKNNIRNFSLAYLNVEKVGLKKYFMASLTEHLN